MHHPEPRFSPAGDSFIEVELGNEMSFDLNVKVQALAHSIREAGIEGVIELVPELASLLVSYDPDRISYDDVVMEIQSIFAQQSGDGVTEMPSRLDFPYGWHWRYQRGFAQSRRASASRRSHAGAQAVDRRRQCAAAH